MKLKVGLEEMDKVLTQTSRKSKIKQKKIKPALQHEKGK